MEIINIIIIIIIEKLNHEPRMIQKEKTPYNLNKLHLILVSKKLSSTAIIRPFLTYE